MPVDNLFNYFLDTKFRSFLLGLNFALCPSSVDHALPFITPVLPLVAFFSNVPKSFIIIDSPEHTVS